MEGIVDRVSADRLIDNKTGAAYYAARITIDAKSLAELKGVKLSPGMPAQVQILTGEGTILQYFLKPLRDGLQSAFREQ